MLVSLRPGIHALSIAVFLSVAATSTAPAAGITQFDFWGFSIAPEPTSHGEKLEIVAAINAGTTSVPLNLDFQSAEYTMHIHGLVLRSSFPNGPLLQINYDKGTVDIYEDSSFNAPFDAQTDPDQVPELDPSEVPAHFKDGKRIVRMKFGDYIALFNPDMGLGTIAYSATELRVAGGSARRVLVRAGMRSGWHMGGAYTDDDGAYIPDGYAMRYDALIRWEAESGDRPSGSPALESTTWGSIKSVYGDE